MKFKELAHAALSALVMALALAIIEMAVLVLR